MYIADFFLYFVITLYLGISIFGQIQIIDFIFFLFLINYWHCFEKQIHIIQLYIKFKYIFKISRFFAFLTQYLLLSILLIIIINQNPPHLNNLSSPKMRRAYGRGLNIAGQIDKTYKNYPKFTPIKQLQQYQVQDVGCGYLQSYYLLTDGQLIKSGHLMDTLTSIRMIRMYKASPFFYRSFKALKNLMGIAFPSLGSTFQQFTLLNRQLVLNNIKVTKAVFNQSAVHLFDSLGNMYVVGENYYGQRATNDTVTNQFKMRKIQYITGQGVQSGNLSQNLNSSNSSHSQQTPLNSVKIADISLGFQHSIILSSQGEAYGCGRAQSSQIQPYKYHHYKDKITRDIITTPQLVFNKRFIRKAACGYKHTVLLTDDDRLYALGSNRHGQCGMDYLRFGELERITQVFFPGLKGQKIVDIKCGSNHTLILSNKNLYFMGNIQSNQNPFALYKQNISSPTIVPLPSRPIKIFANLDRTAVITQDGKAYLYGGADLSKKGGQSGRLQCLDEFQFGKDSVIGLGFSHTIICP